MDYPVILENDDNDTILVSFPDFPEAHTFGEDQADALVHAADALSTVLDLYIKDRRPIPLPSAFPAAPRVSVPVLMETKLLLYATMRDARLTKAALGRRLHVHAPQIDRLLDVRHTSQLGQIEEALRVMGKQLVVQAVDLPKPAETQNPGSANRYEEASHRVGKAGSADEQRMAAARSCAPRPKTDGQSNIAEYCVYTIVDRKKLARAARSGRARFEERKPWTTASKLWETARSSDRTMPVLFGDATDCSRLLYWGLLTDVHVQDGLTRFAVDKVRKISGKHAPQELVLRSSGNKIASGFIRPYAICKTPSFVKSKRAA
jgi:antitoxin HicB